MLAHRSKSKEMEAEYATAGGEPAFSSGFDKILLLICLAMLIGVVKLLIDDAVTIAKIRDDNDKVIGIKVRGWHN